MKNIERSRYNLNHSDCMEEIREIITVNGAYYDKVRIRYVNIRSVKNPARLWQHAMCVIQMLPKNTKIEQVGSIIYEDVHLYEYWLEPRDLLKTLALLQNEGVGINTNRLFLGDDLNIREVGYMQHDNHISTFPGYLYSSPRVSNRVDIPRHPLLQYQNPYLTNAHEAIAWWCELPDYRGDSDGRIGTTFIFLPECRAFFKELKYNYDEKVLFIKAMREEPTLELFLKGAYSGPHGYREISHDIKQDALALEIPIPPEEAASIENFEIYLIDGGGNIFDYHIENRYDKRLVKRIFSKALDTEKQDNIKNALLLGECDTVEFKQYIEEKDRKVTEIIETVVAFANTKGGTVLIGVDDYAVLQGIEIDIAKAAHSRGETTDFVLKQYIGWIRKEISDRLNKTVLYSVDKQEYSGKVILVIKVLEGQQKPYAMMPNKDIYIRRGANNVKPDPDTELPRLFANSVDAGK